MGRDHPSLAISHHGLHMGQHAGICKWHTLWPDQADFPEEISASQPSGESSSMGPETVVTPFTDRPNFSQEYPSLALSCMLRLLSHTGPYSTRLLLWRRLWLAKDMALSSPLYKHKRRVARLQTTRLESLLSGCHCVYWKATVCRCIHEERHLGNDFCLFLMPKQQA